MDEQSDKTRYEAFKEGKPPGIMMTSCGCKPESYWDGFWRFWSYLFIPVVFIGFFALVGYLVYDKGRHDGYLQGYSDKFGNKGYNPAR